jgi:hypothetical protein
VAHFVLTLTSPFDFRASMASRIPLNSAAYVSTRLLHFKPKAENPRTHSVSFLRVNAGNWNQRTNGQQGTHAVHFNRLNFNETLRAMSLREKPWE